MFLGGAYDNIMIYFMSLAQGVVAQFRLIIHVFDR
jgi:ABC-type enterobactin transport system permease subunit